MNRRKFIMLLGGAAAWPLTARAHQSDRLGRVGVLMGYRSDDAYAQWLAAALTQGLIALDWRESGNLRLDWRWAGGDPSLFERYTAELVALRPDVLVAQGSPAVEALRRQSRTTPIVFVMVVDPVGQGFVASLARPGGTITGFTNYEPPMAGKWLGMLTLISPPVTRAAVLYNPATAPFAGLMLRAVEEVAPSFALAVRAAPCRDDAEIEATMTEVAREERGGVLVLADVFAAVHRDVIIESAGRRRIPVVSTDRRYTIAGGLMSYGVDPIDTDKPNIIHETPGGRP